MAIQKADRELSVMNLRKGSIFMLRGQGRRDAEHYSTWVQSRLIISEIREPAQAVAEILRAANVDFCIFGNEEEDSGGDILRLGEEGLFEELTRRNFELFRKYEIKNIICLSPHDYDAFLNDYPAFLGEEWSRLDLKVNIILSSL